MKKITLSALTLSLVVGTTLLTACGGGSNENKETPAATETAPAPAAASSDVSGESVFSSKGCVACHQVDTKTVGPALKDIAKAYNGDKDALTSFLKEEKDAIVDPAQAAVMKPQLATTKALPANELSALVEYIITK
ncbi:MAG: c-type cytochrome [Bacteroidia bacterium]|nr:c-type cytochrome [Bacteroidia bacterium]